jgi:hypothetical protein
MLNSYANTNFKNTNNFNYNINAVSGTIRKSHPKSIITKVKLDDTLLDKINPKYTVTTKKYYGNNYDSYNESKDYPVVILQVMLCGDNYCLVEFVLEEDFQVNENDNKEV